MSKKIFSIAIALLIFYALPVLALTEDYYSTAGQDESDGSYTLLSSDLVKLTASDDNRYISHGIWTSRYYNDNDYIEFDFGPNIDSCAIIESVIITFEWQKAIEDCGNIDNARLRIWDYSSSSWVIDDFPIPLPTKGNDRTETMDATSYINTPEDVNNLKIWFQGKASNPAGGHTKHDFVKVTVTYTIPCDCYTDSGECSTNPACEWCPECSDNQYSGGSDRCVDLGDCNYYCDIDYCDAECGGDCHCVNYCTGDTRLYSGECMLDSCLCTYQTENCNDYDGYHDTGNTRWVETDQCNEKEQKEVEERDYYCDPAGCDYSVTETQWVDTGNTRYKTDGTVCDDESFCIVNDVCTAGICGGSPRDCSELNDQCQEGVCNEDIDACVPDYTNYPLSTPCEADQDLCTVDHCDGSGSCVKDYDVDCSYLGADYCEGNDIWHDEGYCSGGECYASSSLVEDCYYYDEHCSDDEIWYEEGYCDPSGPVCDYTAGLVQDCYYYTEYCDFDKRMSETGFCELAECDYTTAEIEDCSGNNYDDCQDTYYKHYYTETCQEDTGTTQCSPASSVVDCRDEFWCDGQEYCSEEDGVHCENAEPADCSGNDISEVATCYYDPDGFGATFDWRSAFTSGCVEDGCNTGHCTAGDETINHVCADADDTDGVFYYASSIRTCEAECDGAGVECEPKISGDYCSYGNGCNLDTCTCDYQNSDYCPEPGTVLDDMCYYGERSCTEDGCGLYESPIRPCEYCDPVLGPVDITPPIVTDIEIDLVRCCEPADLTAVVSDPKNCNNIVAAEYFLVNEGGCGDPGTGTPMDATDGAFDSSIEAIEAVIGIPCPDGTYNLWIRGKDAAGNWGACEFYLLVVDNGAPTTYNVVAENMTVTATVEGISIVGAEYFIDQMGPVGFGTQMNATDGAFDEDIEDVVAEISAGLSAGLHTVYVHGRDGAGYWGNFGSADFTVYEGPEINITYPTEGWYKDTVTVSHITNGTECDYRYSNNGTESEWFSITCNDDFLFDTNNCVDGEDTCTIEMRAGDGLYGYDSVTFSVDNSAPIITYVLLNQSQIEQNSTINITSDGHDPQGLKSCYALLMSGDDVIESFNLGLDCSGAKVIPENIPDGDYIIKVRARNRADTDSFAEAPLIVGEGSGNNGGNDNGGNSGGNSGGSYGSYWFSGKKECVEKWICTEWSECINGTQTRDCIDENECNTTVSKPDEERSCEKGVAEEPEENGEETPEETKQEIKYPSVGITGLLIGALTDPLTALIVLTGIIIIAYLIYRILKRENVKKNNKGKKGTIGIRRKGTVGPRRKGTVGMRRRKK